MSPDINKLDELHHLVRQLTVLLNNCTKDEVCSSYEKLMMTVEQTFAEEQLLMEKHEFPATRSHLEQHARVLSTMHHAHSSVMRGNRNLAVHIGAHLLPDWFELHNSTLDAAVSVWACYKIDCAKQITNYRNQKALLVRQCERARQ